MPTDNSHAYLFVLSEYPNFSPRLLNSDYILFGKLFDESMIDKWLFKKNLYSNMIILKRKKNFICLLKTNLAFHSDRCFAVAKHQPINFSLGDPFSQLEVKMFGDFCPKCGTDLKCFSCNGTGKLKDRFPKPNLGTFCCGSYQTDNYCSSCGKLLKSLLDLPSETTCSSFNGSGRIKFHVCKRF